MLYRTNRDLKRSSGVRGKPTKSIRFNLYTAVTTEWRLRTQFQIIPNNPNSMKTSSKTVI